jgi:hypothetical protein
MEGKNTGECSTMRSRFISLGLRFLLELAALAALGIGAGSRTAREHPTKSQLKPPMSTAIPTEVNMRSAGLRAIMRGRFRMEQATDSDLSLLDDKKTSGSDNYGFLLAVQ